MATRRGMAMRPGAAGPMTAKGTVQRGATFRGTAGAKFRGAARRGIAFPGRKGGKGAAGGGGGGG